MKPRRPFFSGIPLFAFGRRAPGALARSPWMPMTRSPMTAPSAPLFSRSSWWQPTRPGATPAQQQAMRGDMLRRQQAYRSQRHTPQGDVWRAQAQRLAQHSWQRYLQVAPNADKLATGDPHTRAAVQGILRDIQIARVSLNDRQLRAKAAELRVITDHLRRPDVASVRVIPNSSAGRTPDLLVRMRDGREQRVEVRTLAQGSPLGSRRAAGPPPRVPANADNIAQAIAAKARRGQLTATGGAMRGVAPGGAIVIQMEGSGPAAVQAARRAVDQLDAQLRRWPHVQQIAVHAGAQRIVFTRLASGDYTMRTEARGPASSPQNTRTGRRPAGRAAPRRRGARTRGT